MLQLKSLEHLKSISLEGITKATNTFDKASFIGEGGYGKVYKGNLSISPVTVAIKRLIINRQSGQGAKEFLTEIDLLSGHKHPNLIGLLGYCETKEEKIIVCEYAENGSLDNYITTRVLTWLERLKICVGAARGLEYLHNRVGKHQTIIHRDIKSANILIDKNWIAKVADLGLSKLSLKDLDRSYVVSGACGTPCYIEPEYQDTGIVTKESDVYSFGMVLFEVLCGRLCTKRGDDGFLLSCSLAKYYYEKDILDEIVDPSLNDEMKSDSMNKFAEIAYSCLHVDRKKRPSMGHVMKELEESFKLQIRVEKVKRIFQQFGLNKDGGLNKEELEDLLVAKNIGLKHNSEKVFRLYNMFINDEKRSACDGLLQIYDCGYSDLDLDYEVLGCEVNLGDGKENDLICTWESYEKKVWKIFQQFDLKNDGGLSTDELAALIVATYGNEKSRSSLDFFKHYEQYINGEKGLAFNGLLRIYDQGELDLDLGYNA